MSMYTCCSSCRTYFRVTVQQLQACNGQVRCGRCATVFDAFASLTARTPGKNEDPPPLSPERPAWEKPAPVAQPGTFAVAHATAPAAMPVRGRIETLTLPEDLFDLNGGMRKWRGPMWAWSAGVCLLGVLALAQLLFFFRAQVAMAYPGLRPALVALCQPLSCGVPLPRFLDSLFIESSDLQVIDPSRPQEVLLTASVRNRAEYLQAYPTLELTLTNTMDHPIAKKQLAPKEYLTAPHSEEQGFAPGTEVPVRLVLNTRDLRAAGYRLYLFFPN
ncbi:MAG: zinc-ribbon and DUF3426 domain-containing protein [Burkholderiales bacterium]